MSKAPKKPAKSFTVRLTDEQRTILEHMSAGRPLAEYIRLKALSEECPPIRRRGQYPVKSQEAASQLLGELGRSGIPEQLSSLAESARLGLLELTPETNTILLAACADIAAMRKMLMKALGYRSERDDH